MREFRILGPLEVLLDGRPVELGGLRQRALLAALLVHHGQVVSTERLVDLVWGESAPKTATTSLQNAVAQLRRAAGRRRPRDARAGLRPRRRARRRRRPPLRGPARPRRARSRPASGRSCCGRRSRSGAARRSPIWRARSSRRERSGGSRSCGSTRSRSASPPTSSAAFTVSVIGELETLAALRRCASGCARCACSRSTAAAGRRRRWSVFRETRGRLVDQLGIEPGAELQELHAQILRQEAGAGAGQDGRRRRREVEAEILRRVLGGSGRARGSGSPGAAELSQRLADMLRRARPTATALSAG